jgi:hypothetical protein
LIAGGPVLNLPNVSVSASSKIFSMKSAQALFILVLSGCLDLSALTGNALAQTGFAWACRPKAASYDVIALCSRWVYGSGGEGAQTTRSGTEVYQVDFGGPGGRRTAGGNIQVTTHLGGSTTFNVVCNSVSWSSGIANVRCVREAEHP